MMVRVCGQAERRTMMNKWIAAALLVCASLSYGGEIVDINSVRDGVSIIATPSGTQTVEQATTFNVQPVNGNDNALGVDLSTRSLINVEYSHHEIHSGSMFRVQHNDDAIPATGTGTGGELVIAFYVPDQSKEPHMTWEFVHEGDMTMKVLEGITLSTNGVDRAPKNSNRNSDNTSVLQGSATGSLVSGYVQVGEQNADSIYSGGTVISLKRNYAARNEAASGSRKGEVILKTDEYYAFVLDNNETSTQGGQIRLEFYEHTPKTD